MKLPTGNVTSKRIYLCSSVAMTYNCPKCSVNVEYSNNVPIISYGDYCHVFHCHDCGHESKDKMYSLNSIGDGFVDITPSKLNNLKFFKYELVEMEK